MSTGFSINTNIFALSNQKEMNKTQEALGRTFERLTSGKRINRASDDASGLQIAEGQRADIAAYTVAMRNTNDAVSFLNIADSTQETSGTILTRMTELANQAANGTLSDPQRSALDQEYQALIAELDRTQQTAEFNGQPVTGPVTIQSGIEADANSQTTINIASMSSSSLGLTGTSLLSQDSARMALTTTSTAIDTVSQSRGEIGAVQSRLAVSLSNISTQHTMVSESLSLTQDADIAKEAGDYYKNKIKLQANAALGAQANKYPEQLLKLLT